MTAIASRPDAREAAPAAVQLYGYQRRWLADRSRYKAGLWARQTGKSFTTALEAAIDALETGDDWLLLSRGQRQSTELARKALMHLEAMHVAVTYGSDSHECRWDRRDRGGRAESVVETVTREMITLRNGARLIVLPANPDTARGYTASVLLDEFALHRDDEEIWRAVYGSITRHRRLKLRVVSTPKGQQNRFYRLWSVPASPFSRHVVTIHDAIADGLDIDPDELRRGLDDEEGWQQEYLCQFLDEATAWLTYELILGCESEQATTDVPEPLDAALGELYLGVDVGRRRDLTVLWLAQAVGDVLWTRAVICLAGSPFAEQEAVIDWLMRLGVRACRIDATGLGMQLAERAERRWGGRAQGLTFTAGTKASMAAVIRRRFEDRTIRIPIDGALREDLHSVRRLPSAGPTARFDAARGDAGHADRFWAAALACEAAEGRGRGGLIVI